jgi:hypothetical protein
LNNINALQKSALCNPWPRPQGTRMPDGQESRQGGPQGARMPRRAGITPGQAAGRNAPGQAGFRNLKIYLSKKTTVSLKRLRRKLP